MLVYPDIYLKNVKEITITLLKENNIRALILDVDNTLINLDRELLEGAKEWCEDLKKQGIAFYILSNSNKKEKVAKVAKELDIPYINFAKKPLKGGFLKIQKELGIKNSREIAVARRPNIYRCNRSKQSKNVFNINKTIRKRRYIYNKSKKTNRRLYNKKVS